MVVTNPCCCDLQLGVTILAVVNMVSSVFGLVCYVGILTIEEARINRIEDAETNKNTMFILIFCVITSLISFIVSFLLLVGSRRKQLSVTRLWFVTWIILFLISVLMEMVEMGVGIKPWSLTDQRSVIGIAYILKSVVWISVNAAIHGYQLWVVYAFIDLLKREGRHSPSASPPVEPAVHYVAKPETEPPCYWQQGYLPNTTFAPGPSTVNAHDALPAYIQQARKFQQL